MPQRGTRKPGRGSFDRPSTPGHRPRKRFGQHFLAPAWAQKIVKAINTQPGDVFLEVGPGKGALTLPLAETGAPILAVEIDRDLVADLAPRVPSNVTVLTGDVLHTDVLAFLSGLEPQRTAGNANMPPPQRRFRIVGNLPYNISTPLLFRLIEWHRRHGLFTDATVMLQREVAARLVAKPGTRDYGVLTVMLSIHAKTRTLINLPPGAFRPAPRVDSSVVALTFTPPSVRISDEVLFERMVKAIFSQRRKTLSNALKGFDPTAPAVLALAGLDGRRRPETLQVSEMAQLADLFASVRRAPVL
ncbi:MAG: 16S rRNA (adenine(1518)-N(6)/adenine(1519)-N(6))-dimethyltransferase RsmA [Acidobacteriota bacterium]